MLNKIIEYQRAKGLTNQTFADRIGYNRTSWIHKRISMILDNGFIKSDDVKESDIQEVVCPQCKTMTPVEPCLDDFFECLTCGKVFTPQK